MHFSSIEKLGELPSYDSAEAMDVSELRTLVGTRMGVPAETVDHFIVPFFVSHRWLHTTGPRSGHRPDTEDVDVHSQEQVRSILVFPSLDTSLSHEPHLQ